MSCHKRGTKKNSESYEESNLRPSGSARRTNALPLSYKYSMVGEVYFYSIKLVRVREMVRFELDKEMEKYVFRLVTSVNEALF